MTFSAASSNALRYRKEIVRNSEINKNTIIVWEFNTPPFKSWQIKKEKFK